MKKDKITKNKIDRKKTKKYMKTNMKTDIYISIYIFCCLEIGIKNIAVLKSQSK